jgi:hypothetical protein
MSIVFLYLVGMFANGEIGVGDPCELALHHLLTEESVAILASDVVERDTVIYTMGDGTSKTAILGCRIARPARQP